MATSEGRLKLSSTRANSSTGFVSLCVIKENSERRRRILPSEQFSFSTGGLGQCGPRVEPPPREVRIDSRNTFGWGLGGARASYVLSRRYATEAV